ncbi:MFS transporter [Virgisporangium aliadipatigenens]|uniref:MFS transporter n=1 Tax=Virgisporangium aliadipatigenens TaxID=741659 RepID=A0A8J4DWE1_9ACTN|nr:MFS transporter [Virgisporangium aliadipatigenens]GIJ52421.1 MFS transporter [Virgisporangium aliadipatigenens]
MRNKSQLAVLSLAAFMASLDVFIVNVAFDDIGADLGARSVSELSWVLNAYAIVYAALLVPAGRAADRYGRKGGFLLGLALFTAASAACALADEVWVLVAFRMIQALGAALLTPASLGLVVASAPPEERVRAVRIWAATGAVAAALGPVVGGLLVEASWRWIFLVNVPVGALALVAAARIVRPSRDPSVTRLPDLGGAALLATGVGALTLGLVQGPAWGWLSLRSGAAWAVAVLALLGFVLRSRRHPVPLVEPALLRVRTFAWANVTVLLFSVTFAASLLSVVLWMQQVWGWSAIRTGLGVAPGPLMVPLFAALTQRVRIPIWNAVSLGCLLLAAGGLVNAARLGAQPDYLTDFLPGWLIGGAGVGLALPSMLAASTAELPPARAATGSAVVNMSRQIGTAVGVAMLAAVLGTPVGYPATHAAFTHVWWAMAAFGALAAVTAFGMNPRRRGGTVGAPLIEEARCAAPSHSSPVAPSS